MLDLRPIFFYWDGYIHPDRLKILKDCVYSTRVWNPKHEIVLISNVRAEVPKWGSEVHKNSYNVWGADSYYFY